MKRKMSSRQRPLFHEGPVWQQLDESLQRQLIGRLADLCQLIVVAPPVPLPADEPSTNQQEESDDRN